MIDFLTNKAIVKLALKVPMKKIPKVFYNIKGLGKNTLGAHVANKDIAERGKDIASFAPGFNREYVSAAKKGRDVILISPNPDRAYQEVGMFDDMLEGIFSRNTFFGGGGYRQQSLGTAAEKIIARPTRRHEIVHAIRNERNTWGMRNYRDSGLKGDAAKLIEEYIAFRSGSGLGRAKSLGYSFQYMTPEGQIIGMTGGGILAGGIISGGVKGVRKLKDMVNKRIAEKDTEDQMVQAG